MHSVIAINTWTTINMKKNKAHSQREANIHSSAHMYSQRQQFKYKHDKPIMRQMDARCLVAHITAVNTTKWLICRDHCWKRLSQGDSFICQDNNKSCYQKFVYMNSVYSSCIGEGLQNTRNIFKTIFFLFFLKFSYLILSSSISGPMDLINIYMLCGKHFLYLRFQNNFPSYKQFIFTVKIAFSIL